MKTNNWTSTWKQSVQPRKQRAYLHKAPAHVRVSMLASHLSKELRQKHKRRSISIRKGDKVKVMRGTHRGKSGTIERVDAKRMKAYVTGVETIKRDGSKALYPINPSQLLIIDLDTSDKKRLGAKTGGSS